MKKNFVRIVAAALVALLALTLIPLGAFAVDSEYDVYEFYIGTTDPKYSDYYKAEDNFLFNEIDSIKTQNGAATIKTSDYDKHLIYDGELYDLQGVVIPQKTKNGKADLKTGSSYTINKDNADYAFYFDLAYTPHQHKLSRWYSDGTTHWRECLVCKKFCAEGFHDKFMYQNWCQDGDEDGICNVCGGDVPYHDVTVIESEGGKITVNRDTASHRTKITADVETAEGYEFKQLHFTKVRTNGSRQEVVRYKENGQYWTLMPTYDMEVSAEFIKK